MARIGYRRQSEVNHGAHHLTQRVHSHTRTQRERTTWNERKEKDEDRVRSRSVDTIKQSATMTNTGKDLSKSTYLLKQCAGATQPFGLAQNRYSRPMQGIFIFIDDAVLQPRDHKRRAQCVWLSRRTMSSAVTCRHLWPVRCTRQSSSIHVSSFLTLDPNESDQTTQVAPNTISTNWKQPRIACSQWFNPRRTSTSLNCTVLSKWRNKITTFSSSEEQLTQDRALQKK